MKRHLASLAVIAALAMSSAITTPVIAGPGVSTTWTYYSDDTYTQEVGWRQFTCQGRTIKSGIQTQYVVTTAEDYC
jgi:hypothetical protein